MEIVPQVHQIPGIRGANVFLIVEETGLSLIDTGSTRNAETILRHISQIGRRPEDLTHIILTHFHGDHAGSADELRRRTGAKIFIHEADTAEQRKRDLSLSMRIYARLLSAVVEVIRDPKGMEHATLLKDGDLLPPLGGLEVIHAPGHSPGGICLYSRQRSLVFLGDLIINNVKRLSRPVSSYDSDSEAYRASLRRMASLDFEIGLFSHGPPILQGTSRLVRQMADRPWTPLPSGLQPDLGTLFRVLRIMIMQRLPRSSAGPKSR